MPMLCLSRLNSAVSYGDSDTECSEQQRTHSTGGFMRIASVKVSNYRNIDDIIAV